MPHNDYFHKLWQKASKQSGLPVKDLKRVVNILKELDIIEMVDYKKATVDTPLLTMRIPKDKLLRMACYCPLTGIPNEYMLKDRMQYLLNLAQRQPIEFAVMFIDLNKFKDVNDTYGHSAGDYVLQTVANIMKASVRKSDLVARLHGDEFVILFNDVHPHSEEVKTVCHKIEHLISTIDYQNHNLNLTASFGFAFYPQDGQCIKDLLERSDEKMYKAKKNGNNH